jgi:hypothetical protein
MILCNTNGYLDVFNANSFFGRCGGFVYDDMYSSLFMCCGNHASGDIEQWKLWMIDIGVIVSKTKGPCTFDAIHSSTKTSQMPPGPGLFLLWLPSRPPASPYGYQEGGRLALHVAVCPEAETILHLSPGSDGWV